MNVAAPILDYDTDSGQKAKLCFAQSGGIVYQLKE
jgi:hypothetical protein